MPAPTAPNYIDFPGGHEPLPTPPAQATSSNGVPLQADAPKATTTVSVTSLRETAAIGDLSPLATPTKISEPQIQVNARRGTSFGPGLVMDPGVAQHPGNTGSVVPNGALGNTGAPVLSSNTKSTAAGNFR
jgi:hypothetical protein